MRRKKGALILAVSLVTVVLAVAMSNVVIGRGSAPNSNAWKAYESFISVGKDECFDIKIVDAAQRHVVTVHTRASKYSKARGWWIAKDIYCFDSGDVGLYAVRLLPDGTSRYSQCRDYDLGNGRKLYCIADAVENCGALCHELMFVCHDSAQKESVCKVINGSFCAIQGKGFVESVDEDAVYVRSPDGNVRHEMRSVSPSTHISLVE